MTTSASFIVTRTLAKLLDHRPASIQLFHELAGTYDLDEIDVALLGLDLANFAARVDRDPATFPHAELSLDMTVRQLVTLFAGWSGLPPPDEEDPPSTLRNLEDRVSVV